MHSEHDWTACYDCLSRDVFLLRESMVAILKAVIENVEDINSVWLRDKVEDALNKTHGTS